jgi:hypothetical protein
VAAHGKIRAKRSNPNAIGNRGMGDLSWEWRELVQLHIVLDSVTESLATTKCFFMGKNAKLEWLLRLNFYFAQSALSSTHDILRGKKHFAQYMLCSVKVTRKMVNSAVSVFLH